MKLITKYSGNAMKVLKGDIEAEVRERSLIVRGQEADHDIGFWEKLTAWMGDDKEPERLGARGMGACLIVAATISHFTCNLPLLGVAVIAGSAAYLIGKASRAYVSKRAAEQFIFLGVMPMTVFVLAVLLVALA